MRFLYCDLGGIIRESPHTDHLAAWMKSGIGPAIPFVTAEAQTLLSALLGLAPASKVLYSSDAFHIFELY